MSKFVPTWPEVRAAMESADLDSQAWLDSVDGRVAGELMQLIANMTNTNVIEVQRRYHTNANAHALINAIRHIVMAAVRGGVPVSPEDQARVVEISKNVLNKDKISKDFLAGFMEAQGGSGGNPPSGGWPTEGGSSGVVRP